jgi:hypothetical protein
MYLFLFFSTHYTLRGTDAEDIVICEEMAFMNKQMFEQVVIPLLGMKKTKLFGITTPSHDEHNFFSRMLVLKDPSTDKNIFGVLIVDLACDECKKKNRAIHCRHMQNLLPHWKGSEKFELTSLMYGEGGSDTHLRESMGILTSADDKLFERSLINKLKNRPTWENVSSWYKPTHIFMAIDPNAGGSSDMAIMSIAFVSGIYLVSST